METIKELLQQEIEYANENLEKRFKSYRNNRISKLIETEWTDQDDIAYYMGYEKAVQVCMALLKEKGVI